MAERSLHIGVDGRELIGHPTGVGRYLWQVLLAWTRDPAWPHRITVVVPGDPPANAARLGAQVHWRQAPGGGAGTRWEQSKLPAALKRAGVDVLFAVGYTAPLLTPCPFVLVIHDVSFVAHPEWFRWREGLRRRWLTREAATRAARIITVSEFSASEIVRWLGVHRERITLASPGAPAADSPSAPPALEPLVLFVGSMFNRRHIPTLIEGFALVARANPRARLVLVGDNRTTPRIDPRALAAASGAAAQVEWREYVEDAELDRLYRRARVVAFLSDYEGFGIPPLEGIAHGAPALLLDTPVSREIYGEGACLVPPSAEAIGAALQTLLGDDAAHAALLTRGRGLLERYQWPRTAQIIRAALEEAADGGTLRHHDEERGS